MSLADLERRAVEVCFARAPTDSDFEALGDAARWRIYRTMVRARLKRVCESALPRSVNALGADPFDALFVAWLDEAPPRERFFRAVPAEFLAHSLPKLQDGPPWLADLARFEIATWKVKYADDAGAPATTEIAFDKAPVLTPALALLDVGWAVHKKRKEHDYAEGPQHLCIYRNAKHQAVTMELNPLARDLVTSWRFGDTTLTERVQAVAQARETRIDERFIESLSAMLADFLERGIVLGSRAEHP
ncbi:MAG: putative DNA-binding domain-containing protein [Myxococcota bacterium]